MHRAEESTRRLSNSDPYWSLTKVYSSPQDLSPVHSSLSSHSSRSNGRPATLSFPTKKVARGEGR
jgi:hypothetical protein